MNSYHNQCRRGPGRGECCMPERPVERPNCQMPSEKECCKAPEMPMPRERECCKSPEMPREKSSCHMHMKKDWPIGMIYVPMQQWRELYQPDEGFHQGTIFKELDCPFLGRRMC